MSEFRCGGLHGQCDALHHDHLHGTCDGIDSQFSVFCPTVGVVVMVDVEQDIYVTATWFEHDTTPIPVQTN